MGHSTSCQEARWRILAHQKEFGHEAGCSEAVQQAQAVLAEATEARQARESEVASARETRRQLHAQTDKWPHIKAGAMDDQELKAELVCVEAPFAAAGAARKALREKRARRFEPAAAEPAPATAAKEEPKQKHGG